eukprot:TRINITY_DN65791_c0_g3_i1.p1 TRINITY_DN65791_c0_g3~~TRINITY_DN65791_c0_g3_i1.p1  ORF type:complete len:338 (+),score=25.57 TRINITY_DN65791_c0_g3_i1:481-1494(+)
MFFLPSITLAVVGYEAAELPNTVMVLALVWLLLEALVTVGSAIQGVLLTRVNDGQPIMDFYPYYSVYALNQQPHGPTQPTPPVVGQGAGWAAFPSPLFPPLPSPFFLWNRSRQCRHLPVRLMMKSPRIFGGEATIDAVMDPAVRTCLNTLPNWKEYKKIDRTQPCEVTIYTADHGALRVLYNPNLPTSILGWEVLGRYVGMLHNYPVGLLNNVEPPLAFGRIRWLKGKETYTPIGPLYAVLQSASTFKTVPLDLGSCLSLGPADDNATSITNESFLCVDDNNKPHNKTMQVQVNSKGEHQVIHGDKHVAGCDVLVRTDLSCMDRMELFACNRSGLIN